MVLIPVFLILFAAWMLWGWSVGEAKNIKWLRQWCAPAFVLTAVLMAAGAGGAIGHILTKNKVRNDVAQLIENIDLRIRTGGAGRVISEIEAARGDSGGGDILSQVAIINENLAPDSTEIAFEPSEVRAQ